MARWGRLPTPVTRARFRGRRVLVKRDDALFLAGNKVRRRLPILGSRRSVGAEISGRED